MTKKERNKLVTNRRENCALSIFFLCLVAMILFYTAGTKTYNEIEYTVKSGDTVNSISSSLIGRPNFVIKHEIKARNCLGDGNSIKAGEKIYVPIYEGFSQKQVAEVVIGFLLLTIAAFLSWTLYISRPTKKAINE